MYIIRSAEWTITWRGRFEDELMQQLPAVEEFPDIQYIIQYPQPIPVTFHPFQQLFTFWMLQLFTILVHFHVIQELILIIYIKLDGDNGDNGDNGKISGNVINK
jgi:hypothetical protein